jgi:hypothetical protein
VELETASRACQAGGLTLQAISHVFTISYVAETLGEDEDWLHELSINMFPEDGCLRVYGVGKDGVPAFTDNNRRKQLIKINQTKITHSTAR